MRRFSFNGRIISEETPPYIIAEIGVNHEGSIDTAKRLIELAKEGGADAVKFQAYKAGSLAARKSPAYWDTSKEPTRSQYELFSKYDKFGEEEYGILAAYCKKKGIDFLSTPFDDNAISFLNSLVSCFKIASADITNILFMQKIAATQKPVMLSTGASTLEEIARAVDILNGSGCDEIALLHCVLNYPTQTKNANLGMIDSLKAAFPDYIIGYSDHTVPDPNMEVLATAYMKGAFILEKHFTYDKVLPGNDHYHAMDINDLITFKKRIRVLMELNGKREKRPLESEKPARLNARRSIVLRHSVKAGDVLDREILVCKRPGTGITADNFDEIVGTIAKKNFEEDHILSWSDIKRDEAGTKKAVGIIQARMGSSRFPNKMVALLRDYRLIDWVLFRVCSSTKLDGVILAIPLGRENDVLEEAARNYNITVVRGSDDDVLDRFIKAARKSKADVIVRICADNPYVDPSEIDCLVNYFLESRADYAFNHLEKMDNQYPDGFGAEIFSRAVLERLNTLCTERRYREHVTSYVWDKMEEFVIKTFSAPSEIAYPNVKLDVDYPEDLEKLSKHLDLAIQMCGWEEDPRLLRPVDILVPYLS